MLDTLKAVLNLPTWSVVLTLTFAAMSASSALAGFLVKRQQDSRAAISAAQRSDIAASNAAILEYLFGSTVVDLQQNTVWVLKSAEIRRFERLELGAWPLLKAERDTLLARLQALPITPQQPSPAFDTRLPRDLYDDFIQFRKAVLAAR